MTPLRYVARARLPGRWLAAIAAAFVLAGLVQPASAKPFPIWLEEFRAEALKRGIRVQTLDTALNGLAPIPRVIELDRRQPESRFTFPQYLERVVTASRIADARERYRQHRQLLTEVGQKFGVQPRFIVALWGIESDFGRNTGGFSVIGALATLAHDGRRSKYFRGELINALKILDEGHVMASDMQGSWAGAMGQSQFMPSSFRAYAFDFNGDGRRDIWTTQADVFASAANYLARAGWRDDQTWGRKVRLPAGFERGLADLKVRKYLDEWQRLGVRKADGRDLPKRRLRASIVSPSKSGDGPAYLAYHNFRTILKWNRSNYFALAVGHLSDAIVAE